MQRQLGKVPSTEPGRLVLSSAQVAWTGLTLSEFDQPAVAEEFMTAPVTGQTIVLVLAGSCEIESFGGGCWRAARYAAGSLGFTPPSTSSRLRWHDARNKRTLHVQVPEKVMQAVSAQVPADQRRSDQLNALAENDPSLQSLLLAIRSAALAGSPDLYAQSAAQLLALHMVLGRHNALSPRQTLSDVRLAMVDDMLRDAVGGSISLAQLAAAAGCSRFELLRGAAAKWGETPMRRLTRLRMDRACDLLSVAQLSITSIAMDCGYGSSAHFATAFRRHKGLTPSQYRNLRK